MNEVKGVHDYLASEREACPAWLESFGPTSSFNRTQFFTSRVVYYPGSGNDGHAVKLFGGSHSAHCFVYVDYQTPQARIEAELVHTSENNDRRFRGYHQKARRQISMKELLPDGWSQHVDAPGSNSFSPVDPYAFLEVMKRNEDFTDSHGPSWLAILFLAADGIAAYDALFCQKDGIPPPFAVMIQDHGFGGNYDKFGGGGVMEEVASTCNVFPKYLMVAENTPFWKGYVKVPELEVEWGGMHHEKRHLFKREF